MSSQYVTNEVHWNAHRAMISHLYRNEKRTLKDVMQYMRENHSFQATPKMYKTRIAAWGLDKKNKRREMKAILRKKKSRKADGKLSMFLLRGRLVDLNDVERYEKRNLSVPNGFQTPIGSPPGTPRDLICLTPPRLHRPLMSPEILRTTEKFYYDLVDYVRVSFHQRLAETLYGRQQSSLKLVPSTTPNTCKMMEASLRNGIAEFQNGNYMKAAQYWNHGFMQIKGMIQRCQHADIALLLEQVITLLHCGCPQVALLFRNQISAMAALVLPHHDPRRATFISLSNFRLEDFSELEQQTKLLFVDLAGAILGQDSSDVFRLRLEHGYSILRRDPAKTIDQVYLSVHDLDLKFGPLDWRTLEAISYRTQILYERKNHLESEKCALLYLERANSLESDRFRRFLTCMGWCRVGKSQFMLYKDVLAVQSLEKAVDLHQQYYNDFGINILHDYGLLSAIQKLEILARTAGDHTVAARWASIQNSIYERVRAEGDIQSFE